LREKLEHVFKVRKGNILRTEKQEGEERRIGKIVPVEF
jgi:hypothetical protein